MVALFFALAFGITWLVQLPAVLATVGVIRGPAAPYMNLAGVGLFGPMLAALIVARIDPEGPGARALLRSILRWRVHPRWYVLALVLPTLGFLTVRAAYGLVASDAGAWLYPPADAQHVAALVVAPIGEEIGWRGFALPRLQQRYSRLTASVILGALWGLWHLMMYLISDVSPTVLLLSLLLLIPGSIVFSWLYNRSGGSLLIAILAHVGVHLSNPNQVLSGSTTPFYLNVVVYVVLALAVLTDRAAWRSGSVPSRAA